jgi:hypothetical protein
VKDKSIVAIPVIVQPAIVVVEPRLGAVTIHIEQVRVVITVAMYIIPSISLPIQTQIAMDRAVFYFALKSAPALYTKYLHFL